MRTGETNFGNFVADLMRTEFATDFAMLNTGSCRLNQLIPAGTIQMRMLQSMFPFPDTMCVLKMPGSIFQEAMEEAVSRYPEQDGRFPAISGFKLQFDPSKPAYERISPTDINPDEHATLEKANMYTVTVPSYIAKGGDGFEMFKKDEVKMITDHENSIWLIDLIKQFFKRTSIDYQVVPRNELRRQQRLKLFNTESDN